MNQSQEQFVIKELQHNSSISRNYCLSLYELKVRPNITRLGAIICDLNKNGWHIKGEWERKNNGKDFVYRVVGMPFKKVVYRVVDPTGQGHKEIIKFEKVVQ